MMHPGKSSQTDSEGQTSNRCFVMRHKITSYSRHLQIHINVRESVNSEVGMGLYLSILSVHIYVSSRSIYTIRNLHSI